MEYYCEIRDKYTKSKSKKKHFESNTLNELDKCKHLKLSSENLDIININKILYAYIMEHNKKFDCFLVKREFKLVFIDHEYCPYIKSILSDKKR